MAVRVLHVIDTGGAGGAESVLLNIAGSLDPERFPSRVVPPGDGWLKDRLREAELDVAVIPRRASPDLAFLNGLRRQIRDFRPDVIHAHLLTSSVYGSVAGSLEGGVPLVATFHGLPDIREGDRLLLLKARILSRRANRLVFVAEHLRQKLSWRLGLDSGLSRVIHNGVPLPSAIHREGIGAARRPPIVGAVGNLRPAKDYSTLVAAARLVLRDHPHASFLVAGGGNDEELRRLRAVSEEDGLGERIRFLGFVGDVRSFMGELDVFVSSSVTEGLPLAIVEAAAMGKPVCATRSGGAEEVLEPAGARFLAPVRDPKALARCICAALENRDAADATARVVAQDVRERFGLARMVKGYEELYEEVAQ